MTIEDEPKAGVDLRDVRARAKGLIEAPDMWVRALAECTLMVCDELEGARTKLAEVEAERDELRADARDNASYARRLGWPDLPDGHPDSVDPVCWMAQQMDELRLTLAAEQARAVRVARGCKDMMGGYSGEKLDAFWHGMDTVAAALADNRDKYSVQVLEAIGANDEAAAEALGCKTCDSGHNCVVPGQVMTCWRCGRTGPDAAAKADPSAAYDAKARRFHDATGHIAPGKDAPAGWYQDEDEVMAAWVKFCADEAAAKGATDGE